MKNTVKQLVLFAKQAAFPGKDQSSRLEMRVEKTHRRRQYSLSLTLFLLCTTVCFSEHSIRLLHSLSLYSLPLALFPPLYSPLSTHYMCDPTMSAPSSSIHLGALISPITPLEILRFCHGSSTRFITVSITFGGGKVGNVVRLGWGRS